MAPLRGIWLLAAGAAAEELLVPLPAGGNVALSTRGPSAFRVRFLFQDNEPIDTPMVMPDTADAPFTKVETTEQVGISTPFGSLVVLRSGGLQLSDASGSVITSTSPLGSTGLCDPQIGADVEGGARVAPPTTVADQGECCSACQAADGCTHWVYGWDATVTETENCWLLANVTGTRPANHRTVGGAGAQAVAFSSRGGLLFGRGGGKDDGTQLNAKNVMSFVDNLITYVPHYYSTDGYAALGVVGSTVGIGKTNVFPAGYATDGSRVTWSAQGPFELYLMPAATLDLGTQAYFDLIGAARVPPRYAFGFIASRWGWKDRDYIEMTLKNFREGKYPIDAFIGDFEWFTNESDYAFPPEGKTWYNDFGFNPTTFPNPAAQLASYREDLHIRMGGIRKPRLGGTAALDYARSQGWLLPGEEMLGASPLGYALARNLNFSIPEAREWYAQQNAHYEKDGVSFFWNDEGETDYFTFHWWNVAQLSAHTRNFADRRFYSINRAFSPGMARLGATVWTGDVSPQWADLANTPGMVLNWGLAGIPYVGCDIGGFTGESQADLLTRWLQVGTFMPTMRVHSTETATPHFPWLWGEPYASVMRSALELRYRLVPYHYSLAHAMFTTRRLWMRPLAAEFPDDPEAVPVSSQWFDGGLLVAPVLRQDSTKQIYLPAGTWYAFNSTQTTKGPTHISGQASLEEVPVYVRPGTLVPLAPVVQSTDELPGGSLEVHVYAGADGSFELVEDDGESVGYESGTVRTTRLQWDDAGRKLTWTAVGDSTAATNRFEQLLVVLFEADSPAGPQRSATAVIGDSGSITVPRPALAGPVFA